MNRNYDTWTKKLVRADSECECTRASLPTGIPITSIYSIRWVNKVNLINCSTNLSANFIQRHILIWNEFLVSSKFSLNFAYKFDMLKCSQSVMQYMNNKKPFFLFHLGHWRWVMKVWSSNSLHSAWGEFSYIFFFHGCWIISNQIRFPVNRRRRKH